jgi:hypothetical protein
MASAARPVPAEARKSDLRKELNEAAELEASDVHALPGLKDTWGHIINALRGKDDRNPPSEATPDDPSEGIGSGSA